MARLNRGEFQRLAGKAERYLHVPSGVEFSRRAFDQAVGRTSESPKGAKGREPVIQRLLSEVQRVVNPPKKQAPHKKPQAPADPIKRITQEVRGGLEKLAEGAGMRLRRLGLGGKPKVRFDPGFAKATYVPLPKGMVNPFNPITLTNEKGQVYVNKNDPGDFISRNTYIQMTKGKTPAQLAAQTKKDMKTFLEGQQAQGNLLAQTFAPKEIRRLPEWKAIEEGLKSKDNSPDGPKARALVAIGRRDPQEKRPVGGTPDLKKRRHQWPSRRRGRGPRSRRVA